MQAITRRNHASFCLALALSTKRTDEALILSNPISNTTKPVAVGDLICKTGANAGLLNSASDYIQAAFYSIWAGMVINDTCCTATNGIDHKYFSACPGILQR